MQSKATVQAHAMPNALLLQDYTCKPQSVLECSNTHQKLLLGSPELIFKIASKKLQALQFIKILIVKKECMSISRVYFVVKYKMTSSLLTFAIDR